MAAFWYPNATHENTPNSNPGSPYKRNWPETVDTIVMHHTDGTASATIGWFANVESQVSAHFLVARDGSVHQFVSLGDIAWQAGNWDMNVRSVGVEHEQYQTDGQWTDWPAVQLNASVALISWLLAAMPSKAQIIPHHAVVSTECPGNLPIDDIAEQARSQLSAAKETGHDDDRRVQ